MTLDLKAKCLNPNQINELKIKCFDYLFMLMWCWAGAPHLKYY